jgi:hypothetical protein
LAGPGLVKREPAVILNPILACQVITRLGSSRKEKGKEEKTKKRGEKRMTAGASILDTTDYL